MFTCDRDENGNIISDWYKIGETYKGTAPIVQDLEYNLKVAQDKIDQIQGQQ